MQLTLDIAKEHVRIVIGRSDCGERARNIVMHNNLTLPRDVNRTNLPAMFRQPFFFASTIMQAIKPTTRK
jgi:hypothetical protein